MDLNAPQTQALWEKLCCSNQSWYRTAEDIKHHSASLEEENTKLRELFPKILNALGNGSGCKPEVSLEFLQGIPKEVELVVKNLKYAESFLIDTSVHTLKSKEDFELAENERIDVAKQLESEKKMHAETQNKLDDLTKHTNSLPWHWLGSAEATVKELDKERKMHAETQYKLDEMTAYADSLAQGLPCLPKDVEVLREANARLAQENHEMLEQLFQTAVGLLSTYGKFACMHPEELLMYLKNELKK